MFNLSDNKYQIKERKRRRATASRKESGEKWVLEEALRALDVEKQYSMAANAKSLTISFPDPEITKNSIHEFSDAIVNIHVISPLVPRYCMVTLKDDANIEEVIERINQTPFGNGYLKARIRRPTEVCFYCYQKYIFLSNINVFILQQETTAVPPEGINPRTLYVGNLSPAINAKTLKEKFAKSLRMDIGFAQKMKLTRWAFVTFANVDDAIEAYKMTVNSMMDDRNLIVRFRRVKNKNISNGNSKDRPKMNENECEKNENDITTTTTTTLMTTTTSLVDKDKNEIEMKDLYDKKVCNTPMKNECSISKEQQSIANNDDDDDDFYDDDDDDELPSNILTALNSSSVVLQEPSKSTTISSSIAPPSPLMQEEDAIFEPSFRAENIIMDTPSPSLPSNTPTQDEGTPNHLTEQLLLPSLFLQDDDVDDNELSNGNINPPNKVNSSCDVVYSMPLLDTPQSSLSIHDESLPFDASLLLHGTQPEDDEDPPPTEMPFKDNCKKTQLKSTMQDSCDITCFFSLDSSRVPALLEAETSDEVMARLSNEATPLSSPLFQEDDDNDYQVFDKTPLKTRSTNKSTISCSLGHLQSKNDNLSDNLTISASKSSFCSAEKDYKTEIAAAAPRKEETPAIKASSCRKNFTLENGFNCFDWSFSEDGED